MSIQDYTTEELKAELKRRADLAKAEKAKVKRCNYSLKIFVQDCRMALKHPIMGQKKNVKFGMK